VRSREIRRREACRLIVGAAVVVAVLFVFWAAVEGSMMWLMFFQTIAAFVTAGIVWWYTKETQRLRETAQQQVEATYQQIEVQQRPLVIVEPQRSDLLIIHNIGNSAAINIKIRVAKGPSTVMIPLLTHSSGISIRIDTDGEALHARSNLRAWVEEGLLSHDYALFIDHDSIRNGYTLHIEYQNVAMHVYVIEERVTMDIGLTEIDIKDATRHHAGPVRGGD
jgi:hypothetical protein